MPITTLQELKDACNRINRQNCSFPHYQQYIVNVLLKDVSILPPRFQLLLSDYRLYPELHEVPQPNFAQDNADTILLKIRNQPLGDYLKEYGYLKYLLISQETADESMKEKIRVLINKLMNIPE
jgi:hypothetical protein